MNKLLVIGLGLGALALASQSHAATLAPPAPDPFPPPPEPDFPPAPVSPSLPPDVSVSLPAGWRRLTQNEVTPSLTSAALDILKLGDKPGTKYPFQYDGMAYYAGVEQYQGKRNISLFVKE